MLIFRSFIIINILYFYHFYIDTNILLISLLFLEMVSIFF